MKEQIAQKTNRLTHQISCKLQLGSIHFLGHSICFSTTTTTAQINNHVHTIKDTILSKALTLIQAHSHGVAPKNWAITSIIDANHKVKFQKISSIKFKLKNKLLIQDHFLKMIFFKNLFF